MMRLNENDSNTSGLDFSRIVEVLVTSLLFPQRLTGELLARSANNLAECLVVVGWVWSGSFKY